jgi:AcrR family transcriptional regulator
MTVKRKPRPYRSDLRAAAADETRTRIVAAARALLGEGKDKPVFSFDAVAREAGVTRLTVYNQFGSKQGLLEAVFDDMAREGGLFELPSVLAEPDVSKALRRFVSVFCKFYASRRKVMPRFSAMVALDDDIAASLKQRTERRRHGLTALVGRLSAPDAAALVDLLFAATSFETFDALSVRNRSADDIEELIQQLVEDLVARYGGKTGKRRSTN